MQMQLAPGEMGKMVQAQLDVASLPPIDTTDPKQVEQRTDEYFKLCVIHEMKPGMAGWALALGVTSETLRTWGKGEHRNDGRSATIKRGKALLEALWEQYMLNGKINPVTGIFIAKNNYGYRDVQEVEVTPANPLRDGLQTPAEIEARYNELPDVEET